MILGKIKPEEFVRNINIIIDNFDDKHLSDESPVLNSKACPAKNKFQSFKKLIINCGILGEFKEWLKKSEGNKGECKSPYLFASIFFNYHTKTSAEFTKQSVAPAKKRWNDRTDFQFAFDLVSGWIPELIISLLLKKHGIEKTGSDKDYVIKKPSVSSSSDFSYSGHSIELMSDLNSFLWGNDRLDFRGFDDGGTKWENMLENEGWLLVLCSNELKYFLYHTRHLNDCLKFTHMSNPHPVFKCNHWTKSTGWKEKLTCFDLNEENLLKNLEYIRCGKVAN